MLCLPQPFRSRLNPAHQVEYTHINPGAPNTLLFCYGAATRSVWITTYQDFLAQHNDISMICVDRWTLPADGSSANASSPSVVARESPVMFTELSQITLELLDHLKIGKFSIFAHSAGAYSMLSLAAHCQAKDPARIKYLFPLCTHIPAKFTGSSIMKWMCTMPDFMFNSITKLDAMGGTVMGKFVQTVTGTKQTSESEYSKMYIDSPALQEERRSWKPSPAQKKAADDCASIDYRMLYDRYPGIDMALLIEMWHGLESFTGEGGRVVWITGDGEVFFGPDSVRRLLGAVFGEDDGAGDKWKDGKVEMICLEGATHASILVRREAFETMVKKVVAD